MALCLLFVKTFLEWVMRESASTQEPTAMVIAKRTELSRARGLQY